MNDSLKTKDADVLIIGGGPAGLSAALELDRVGIKKIVLVDREAEFGGIPRHCNHIGFGWHDLRRLLPGPAYAKHRLNLLRKRKNIELLSCTTVTGGNGSDTLHLTGPEGLSKISAKAVLLATGCHERPRAARLIPGSRPYGVFTTGSLQQLVYLKKQRVGDSAVVVGAEHVSFSAIHTLTKSGARVVAMVTAFPKHQTYPPLKWITASVKKVPIITESEVIQVEGQIRVKGIVIRSTSTGKIWHIPCDTLVFTGHWIPNHELSRNLGLTIDQGTLGPQVDLRLQTSKPGFFAAGNLLHPGEIADYCALDGRHVAASIFNYLKSDMEPLHKRVPIAVCSPIQWIFPNCISSQCKELKNHDFILRVSKFLEAGKVIIHQGNRLLHSQTFSKLIPNRSIRLNCIWKSWVDTISVPLKVSWVSL